MKVLTRPRELVPYQGGVFVPTMGALHRGHGVLIAAAKTAARSRPSAASGKGERGSSPSQPLPVVVSIFVNPKQFGPGEDYERYPRTPEKDLAYCEDLGVDAVFMPGAETIYPPGFSTQVRVGELGEMLCGAMRPGHFDGVATVVTRLFGMVRPTRALFGWKDAQQLIILRRVVEDLALGVAVEGVETVREADGLACSSRNAYLSPAEREKAAGLYRALRKGEAAAREGARAAEIVARVRKTLRADGLAAEYVELRRVRDLAPLPEGRPPIRETGRGRADADGLLLAAAVRVGETRLIDNVRFGGR